MKRTLGVSRLVVVVVLVALGSVAARGGPDASSCWGQASKVYAQLGSMGAHASSYETPRLGLRNLARMLYDLGAIEDDSMQALGAFVALTEGLTIDACL